MKLVIDMNLSPEWVPVFESHAFKAVHWSSIGDPSAPDTSIMQWARENEAVVFTHDLDFGTLLAHTQSRSLVALDILTTISLVHRRMDAAIRTHYIYF